MDVNWNNLDNARPVVCFEHWCMTLPRGEFYMIDLLYGMIDRQELLIDLFHAYYAARLTKRNTSSQLAFEIDYEEQLIALCDELLDESYQIGPSMCFIVYDPVQREIFAASFRDRVVHHLIYRSIYDIIDRQLIHDAWSCRVGRGTHYGVRRIDHRIRSCSHNYSQDCYILKLDIQ
ncbi:MAG: hypothetical protein H6766_06645 [Candidatus Peribacteria bacterium]|nr:MAG: hypothetical protein H6766_06645 [Candidatus Peribacteria bacterium]